eukprot:TRINITY_DN1941_c0_g4_i1.p1 TRINITY_DN1941_c0_g4~~TRINITY_DN1941_c0_g4_i1.p1  ORF type:complete len:476 (-),score=90.59 TRINITY_DN1941_c0_g4_i1:203-1573(-)
MSEGHIDARFSVFIILFEGMLILFYGLFSKYVPPEVVEADSATFEATEVEHYYPMFQDVHVMIFVGFGFLMTFVKRYGFSAVGLNFIVAALSVQWGIMTVGFFHQSMEEGDYHKLELGIPDLIAGDFAAGACLISLGAILGKTSPFQTVVMVFFELIFYAINEAIGVQELKAIDMGGSMYIHTFGAYFGLAVSMIITPKEVRQEKPALEGSVYHSDIFAMIGTLFLWMYWPSFNGALAPASSQHRVVINTVLSITSSCIMGFGASAFLRHGHKFDMVDIQNATLAGGVAVGSSSDLVIEPWGAMLIGATAGTWSVIGYVYIGPFLYKTIGLHDTCGVHNLHGMPGIIGGLSGVVSSSLADETEYGESIWIVFPARKPEDLGGEGRTASEQASFQLATLAVSIGIGIVGGLITGTILNLPFCQKPEKIFNDSEFWETPAEGTPGSDTEKGHHEMKQM